MMRTRNRRGEGSKLREELVEAASSLIEQACVAAPIDEVLSLRAVTRAVGAAPQSVYLHFSDKTALVREVITRRFHELDLALTTAATQAEASARSPAPTEEPFESPAEASASSTCGEEVDSGPSHRERREGASTHREGSGTTSSRVEGSDVVSRRVEWAGLRARCLAYCAWGLEHPGHYRLLFESRATGHLGVGFEGSPGEGTFTSLLRAVAPLVSGDPHAAATSLWISLHGMVTLRAGKPGFPWPPIEDLVDRALRGLS